MKICYLGKMGSTHTELFLNHFSKKNEVHNFGQYCQGFTINVHQHNMSILKKKISNKETKDERNLSADGIELTDVTSYIIPQKSRKENIMPMTRKIFQNIKRPIIQKIKHQILKKELEKIQPDIVHAFNVSTWWAEELTKFNNYKTILTCNGDDLLLYPYLSKSNFKHVSRVINNVNYIHVQSKYMKKEIIEKYNVEPSKIFVINWGSKDYKCERDLDINIIKKTKSELGIKKDDIIITYPKGFRNETKQNYMSLVKGILPIIKSNKRVKLIMLSYGLKQRNNNKYNELIMFIKKNNIINNVLIVDNFLTAKYLNIIYNISDIGIILDEWDAFAIGLTDFMKYGIVPILSNIETYNDYFNEGENCLFVNQKDINAISNAIMKCVENLDYYKSSILDNNDRYYRKYSDNKVQLTEIEKMYRSLINNEYSPHFL